MRPPIRVMLLLTCLGLPGAARAAWDVERLMQALAQQKSSKAVFVERKTIALLDKPLESSGELSYQAPDRLEKRTLKPKPERMLLDKDVLTIERGKQKISVQLDDYPEIRAFVDSIRGTLAGDRKSLERYYALSVYGTPERWKLTLLPSDQKIAALLARITFLGHGHRIDSIEYLQADGDRSLMTIEALPGT
ncbi:MAG: outer membrane lipoprotein carrier protein LolA [Betaproteobacteria bacterium]|nr:outer membrane lipoprotein carrier protein LolA [Betaproteobacteria bacterium]